MLFWVILGHFGAIFGPFWPFWAILDHFGSFLGHFGQFWVIFGLFWVILGHFWAIFWCYFFVAKYAAVLFKSLLATLIADRMERHIFSCFIKPKNSGNEGEHTREFKTKRMMTKRYNETCTSYKMKLVGTFDCSDSVATGP